MSDNQYEDAAELEIEVTKEAYTVEEMIALESAAQDFYMDGMYNTKAVRELLRGY